MTEKTVTQEVFDKLQFIDTSRIRPGRYQIPDFLVIGPQRTGTTWLASHLMNHPQVFLPTKKEIYFFNYLKNRDGQRYRSDRLDWYSKRISPSVHDFLLRCWRNFKIYKTIRLGDLNMVKYYSPTLFGEATASYAVMEEELIDEVLLLNPNLKAIMFIRNPIDRAWSHAKKDLVKRSKRDLSEVSFQEFKAFYTDSYQIKCSKYISFINLWSAKLEEGNLFVGIFDDIRTQPGTVLANVEDFLGIEHVYDNGERIAGPIGTTEHSGIPPAHHEFLSELFKDELTIVNQRFGKNWQ